jgi:hypothetical protein
MHEQVIPAGGPADLEHQGCPEFETGIEPDNPITA